MKFKKIKTVAAACAASALLAATLALAGCSASATSDFHDPDLGNGWEVTDSLELEYAEGFTVDYYDGGYKLICIENDGRYLVVPDGAEVPDDIDDDIYILEQPMDHIYMVATDTMCFFDALDEIGSISIASLEADEWESEVAQEAMENGDIVYGGKYDEPDFEVIVSEGCRLAIESTMINHSPETKEKLEDMGIIVLTEQSSYETNPLGRTEWVKLYGALFDKEDLAEEVFEEQIAEVESIETEDVEDQTVAFFYINSNGSPVVRKPGDYITMMISMAGGEYVFSDIDDDETSSSSITMEVESFYIQAKDADVIIYNSTTIGEISSIDELVEKNDIFEEFAAVQSGNVWCCEENMYQMAMSSGEIVSEINAILAGEEDYDYQYFFKLE